MNNDAHFVDNFLRNLNFHLIGFVIQKSGVRNWPDARDQFFGSAGVKVGRSIVTK